MTVKLSESHEIVQLLTDLSKSVNNSEYLFVVIINTNTIVGCVFNTPDIVLTIIIEKYQFVKSRDA